MYRFLLIYKNRGKKTNKQTNRTDTRTPCRPSIYQKVVGDGPHAFVRQDDPDDHDVSDHGHRYDGAVGDGPQRHLPGRLDQAVGVAAEVHRRDGGSVRGGRSGGVVGRLHLLCVGSFARVGGLVKNRWRCLVTGGGFQAR